MGNALEDSGSLIGLEFGLSSAVHKFAKAHVQPDTGRSSVAVPKLLAWAEKADTRCVCSVAICRLKGSCTITPGLGSRLHSVNLGWVDGTSCSAAEILSEAISAATSLFKTTSAVGERGRGDSESLTSRRFNIEVQSLPSSPIAIFGAIPNSSWQPMMRSSSVGAGRHRDSPTSASGKSTGQDLAGEVDPNLSQKLEMAAVPTMKQ